MNIIGAVLICITIAGLSYDLTKAIRESARVECPKGGGNG